MLKNWIFEYCRVWRSIILYNYVGLYSSVNSDYWFWVSIFFPMSTPTDPPICACVYCIVVMAASDDEENDESFIWTFWRIWDSVEMLNEIRATTLFDQKSHDSCTNMKWCWLFCVLIGRKLHSPHSSGSDKIFASWADFIYGKPSSPGRQHFTATATFIIFTWKPYWSKEICQSYVVHHHCPGSPGGNVYHPWMWIPPVTI